MEQLEGKVAVITGGASGMGLAFARRFARDGMRLVLADVEVPALDAAVAEFEGEGVEVIGVATDVSDAEAMDRLADAAFDRFGTVHVVCNNAGVSGSSAPVHELTTAEWAWVLGVNLWGVIHGHRVFQPRLVEQGEGHIVNTASMAGHTAFNGLAPYHATKHAVVALSEVAYHELAAAGSPVGISVLCPGFVNTRIAESDRNKPEELTRPLVPTDGEGAVDEEEVRAMIRDFFAMQQPPEQVAELVRDAVVEQRFYVFTDDVWTSAIAERHEDIVTARNPRPRGSMFEESMRG
ncbi:SDR family NAD(P)-dependent oxidoreductase [Actinomarinicola tropica]|uniref:SDR family NAD(P)-dependent oxidoreductase n=1 Tax=Actinomarinicola tropica TaxID=2789776 RepID=A0A5Q2RG69_9ACTN|nr:SDR family NAD(P)-dependent oxidoreductase [Actinomarinicola tropica]QGG95798.1 SDR family NAD(P)-dependent oxidoreductase [Actinomarinicola tropica]